MPRRPSIALGCFYALILVAGIVLAREKQAHQLNSPDTYVDIVGDVDGTHPAPQKVLQDTVWIATWTFDTGVCNGSLPAGWMQGDNYIRTGNATGGNFVEPGAPPSVYWNIDDAHSGQHLISGNAARLGYIDDCCAANPSGGYAYGWYQGLRFNYEADGGPGVEEVTFDYLLDSELGFDDLRVESDENCESFDLYEPDMTGDNVYPGQIGSDTIRDLMYEENGLNQTGTVTVRLFDYSAGSHCFYIAFASDGGFDTWDGELTPTVSPPAAMVVDNVVITDANGTITEDFAGGMGTATPMNMHDAKPFNTLSPTGSFARTFPGISENDPCTWNKTCAILNTDNLTPSIDATMRFNAPGSFVMKGWLDDVIITPWVYLDLGPADAQQTILQFRRFPGNYIVYSWIVQNWSIRGGYDVNDGMGGIVPCTQNWGHVFQWNALSTFRWVTSTFDASNNFDPSSEKVQVRFRQSDWRWIGGGGPPGRYESGPGPHIDRIRIGRRVITGPVLDEGSDARSQAQDAFATEIHPLVTPAGEHHRPRSDHSRFGTIAFSQGADLGIGNSSPNLITGDSITCNVFDARQAGGITSIGICAAIVLGPHAGLAPPPHIVDSNTGLFRVAASRSLTAEGTPIEGNYFVDLDDEYFVGGDEMHYFWFATDTAGGFSSLPVGLNAMPASLEEAQEATQGLFQVNFLPIINWNAAYLADVAAAAPHGKLDPHSNEALYITGSEQWNCILYVNHLNSRRRSGDVNRTSFMYIFDPLGYRGRYDAYDHTGMGNTNNHLGGRATEVQAGGYRLIVYDTGNHAPGRPLMSTGDPNNLDMNKVDQDGWFQSWLHNGGSSEAGTATLWLLGADLLDENSSLTLYANEMGTSLASSDQGLTVNPDVEGQGPFTFQNGHTPDFSAGPKSKYSLAGGCPTIDDYDGLAALGTGVAVYRFAKPSDGTLGDAAVVMNADVTDGFNTIMMSHAWGDIHEEAGSDPSNDSAGDLMDSILRGALGDCARDPNATATGGETPRVPAPARTVLHPNYPNPFNPMTTISFDLAEDGSVKLRVFDVSGRLVRTLVDRSMERNRHEVVWNGTDNSGMPVSSGMYLYRLEAAGFRDTRKMVVLR